MDTLFNIKDKQKEAIWYQRRYLCDTVGYEEDPHKMDYVKVEKV